MDTMLPTSIAKCREQPKVPHYTFSERDNNITFLSRLQKILDRISREQDLLKRTLQKIQNNDLTPRTRHLRHQQTGSYTKKPSSKVDPKRNLYLKVLYNITMQRINRELKEINEIIMTSKDDATTTD